MSQLLDRIIALQSAADQLREAETRLAGIPDWMSELHDEYSVRKAEIDALEAVAEDAARERREAEGEISETQDKLLRYQLQLNQVTTQREYGALLQEIDGAKNRITELEDLGIESMEQREAALEELEEQRQLFQDLNDRYHAELAKWEAEKPAVTRQANKLKRTIKELRGEIKRPYLVAYDRVAERHGGDALSQIRQHETARKGPRSWHCGSCNFNVRPQMVVEVGRSTTLMQCDSCKRILYLPVAEAEAEEA